MTFPGFTEDPIGVLAGAAASVMTSRREGFGLAVAESLAAGTPVVTYDVDYGPAELVEDGVNGRVVPDGSIEQLAGALVEVLADRGAWRQMSRAAPAAAERLRPDVVAAQWLDLAADVAARIDLPRAALLVEDLRVRRGGLEVVGVAIGGVGGRARSRRWGSTVGRPSRSRPPDDAGHGSAPVRRRGAPDRPGCARHPALVGRRRLAGRSVPGRAHRGLRGRVRGRGRGCR